MKIKQHNSLYFIFFGIIFFSGISCEKKIDGDFNNDGKEFLIVDGIMTNENKNQIIHLSQSVTSLNSKPLPVSGADISVSDGIFAYLFKEDTLGRYVSELKFSALINKLYTLNIEYENKTYTAQARAVPVLSQNSLNYVRYNDSLYHFPQAVAEFNPNEAAMYEVIADWSFVSGYENFSENETHAKMFFYILKTIDVNEIFHPAYEQIYFPKGTKLTVKKYSLSPDHEKFVRSLLMETQWNGGFFDTEEDNVYTNLSEGAFGFFAASNVLSDSIIVQ